MEKIIELLSNTEQANIVMQNIASYVIYIYPGFISIYLYNFFVSRTTKNTQALVVKSFAISYLYNLIIQASLDVLCFIKQKPSKNSVVYNMILIVVSFLVPYIGYRFKRSKIFAGICTGLGIETSATDVPLELLSDEGEKYTCLKVYLKDEPYVYIGYLGSYEYEDGHDKYLILTSYRKYYIKNNRYEKIIARHGRDTYKEKVFVKFEDIKIIEKIEEDRAKEIYKK